MKEQIKELRVKIDGLSQLTKQMLVVVGVDMHGVEIKFQPVEIGECYKSLILAKAWLGKVLEELGTENPYKSGYKEVKDIEPTADKDTPKVWHLETHIEKVDWLRQEIETVVNEIKQIPVGDTVRVVDVNGVIPEQSKFVPFSREFAIARTCSYTHIRQAKFWLGFELQRIRENN